MVERFDTETGVKEINEYLMEKGFMPRDADGADFQRKDDRVLRFKTGTVYGEVTVTLWVNDRQVKTPIRILGPHQMADAKHTIDQMISLHTGQVE
jgi:hypothetical protein